MICVADKSKCSGCTACVNICPKGCISMSNDEEGFLYPVVDLSLCVNCHKCENVCPILEPVQFRDENINAVVARIKDPDILLDSSSGGFFTGLCNYVIHNHGIVYGAAFDENMKVHHASAETIEESACFRGSKYVQSELDDIFVKVKQSLISGRLVCFSGTPCQVAGIRKYLQKDYDNLITVDLVCHGVPSPLLWEHYIVEQEVKYRSKIKKVKFRSKTYGYQCGSLRIDFVNGQKYIASSRIDPMLKSFFKNIGLRHSCYHCKFKSVKRCSDFTLYDCWYPEKLLKKKDDDKGYTSVIIQSDKGRKLLTLLEPDLEIVNVSLVDMLPVDGGNVLHSVKKPVHRDDFYTLVSKEGIYFAVQEYFPIKKKDFLIESTKLKLKRIKILTFLMHSKRAYQRWKRRRKLVCNESIS